MKKYIAKTNISINVVLSSGVNRHITFDALTSGGSVFYTEDPEIQSALEHHYKFGRLFHLSPESIEDNNPRCNGGSTCTAKENEATNTTENGNVSETSETEGLKSVVVTDPDAAKAYLADHFGISRTKLKTIKAIKDVAEANGIVFEGI